MRNRKTRKPATHNGNVVWTVNYPHLAQSSFRTILSNVF
jgi:hypothetical protein